MARRSPLGDAAFFDPAEFPWIPAIEDRTPEIQRELAVVLADRDRIPNFRDISPDQSHLAAHGMWKTFFLYAYGYRADDNCARCPTTSAAVETIPGLQTAFFSVLEPRARIAPHRGPYKGLLRYHLGLKIPREATACGIRVGDRTEHWQPGQSLVFDDTFEHEAWNDTNEQRVILFVDFERPLPRALELLNRTMISVVRHSPLVQDGLKRFEQWNLAHAAGTRFTGTRRR